AWGDYIPRPGVNELVQPAMRPVFNTKQTGDVLLSVARQLGIEGLGGGATTYYDFLRTRWEGISGGGDAWRQALQRVGVYPALPEEAGGAGAALAGGAAPVAAAAAQQATQGQVAQGAAPAPQPAAGAASATAGQPLTFQGD